MPGSVHTIQNVQLVQPSYGVLPHIIAFCGCLLMVEAFHCIGFEQGRSKCSLSLSLWPRINQIKNAFDTENTEDIYKFDGNDCLM